MSAAGVKACRFFSEIDENTLQFLCRFILYDIAKSVVRWYNNYK